MHYTHGGFVTQNVVPVLLAIICTFLVALGATIYRPSFLRIIACIIAGPGMLALALCIDNLSHPQVSLEIIATKLRHSRASLHRDLRLPNDLLDAYIIPMLSHDFRSSYSDLYNSSGQYYFTHATVDVGVRGYPRDIPVVKRPEFGSATPDYAHGWLMAPNNTSCQIYLGGHTFVTPIGFFKLVGNKMVQLPIRHRLDMKKIDNLIIIRHKSKRYTVLNPMNGSSYEFMGSELPAEDQYTLSRYDIGIREDPQEEIAS